MGAWRQAQSSEAVNDVTAGHATSRGKLPPVTLSLVPHLATPSRVTRHGPDELLFYFLSQRLRIPPIAQTEPRPVSKFRSISFYYHELFVLAPPSGRSHSRLEYIFLMPLSVGLSFSASGTVSFHVLAHQY